MRCPICDKPIPENITSQAAPGSSTLPFCSERCKLIDLGRWLDGKYQIPVDDADDERNAHDERDPDESS